MSRLGKSTSPKFNLNSCRPKCTKAALDCLKLENKLLEALEDFNFEMLEQQYPNHYHNLPKITIAGCPNGCSQPKIKDFGIIGYLKPKITSNPCSKCLSCVKTCLEKAITLTNETVIINQEKCLNCGDCIRICPSGTIQKGEQGWELRIGGRVGRHPHFAEQVGTVQTDEKVVAWVIETLLNYIKDGEAKERLTHFLERISKKS